jgi:predicted nucleotidyltransferase
MDLTEREQMALNVFCQWIRQSWGKRISELALFGSRSRGEGNEESDLDVLVAVESLTFAEGQAIGQYCGDILTQYDVLISPFAVSSQRLAELRRLDRLIAREIDRDGLAL